MISALKTLENEGRHSHRQILVTFECAGTGSLCARSATSSPGSAQSPCTVPENEDVQPGLGAGGLPPKIPPASWGTCARMRSSAPHSLLLLIWAGLRSSSPKNATSVQGGKWDVGSLSKQFSAPGSQLFPSALKLLHNKSNACLTNTYRSSAGARNFLSKFLLSSTR